MLLAYAAHVEQGDGPVEQHLVEFGVPPVDAQDQGQHVVRGGEPGHGGGRLEQERHQRHGAEPVPALAVPGNGVLGVLLVLHRAAVASPRVPRPDGQGFVAERGGEGRGVLHLFAMNDRPREALGVHPPVPHVVGADGGEIRGHTATAGPVLRHGFPFLFFHVHDDEPRPACRREPGHVREEGVGGHAVPVGVRLDGAEGVGQNTLRPPLVDEAGEHVHDGGREVAVGGPARPDVVLLVRFVGVARQIGPVPLDPFPALVEIHRLPALVGGCRVQRVFLLVAAVHCRSLSVRASEEDFALFEHGCIAGFIEGVILEFRVDVVRDVLVAWRGGQGADQLSAGVEDVE